MQRKVKSIIIEDEIYDRQVIEKILLENYSGYLEIVDSVSGTEDAISSIRKHSPELLFLDIELNGDRNGAFNILDKVGNNFKIIFVTAKSEQDDLLKAIRLSCIDYLIKPTRISDFELPIRKVFEEISNEWENGHRNIETFRHNVGITDFQDAKISLQEGYTYKPVFIKSIVRCEAQGNYTRFYFQDHTNSLINGNLKSFEDRLSEFGFTRISKSDLINISCIRFFSRKNLNWEVALVDNKTLYISNQRKQSFLFQYNKFHLS
jgi:two-component system, LytTR family, response regulator